MRTSVGLSRFREIITKDCPKNDSLQNQSREIDVVQQIKLPFWTCASLLERLVQVLATALPIQLSANAPGK